MTTLRRLLASLVVLCTAVQPGISQTMPSENRIAGLLDHQFEYKMISSGKNFPSINPRKGNLGDVCILLHHRVQPAVIQGYFGWDKKTLDEKLKILTDEGLVRKSGSGEYLPTIMVIAPQDSAVLVAGDEQLVDATANRIENKIAAIRKSYDQLSVSKAVSFEKASLLILSDVLLDNWQINNVEKLFLESPRPLRNGMRYYYSIQQKEKGQPEESFGIYGNAYQGYGEITIGMYGNRRGGKNFFTMSTQELSETFDTTGVQDGKEFRKNLLLAFVKEPMRGRFQQGFERLGFSKDGKRTIPVLSESDVEQLSSVAGLFTGELIGLLNGHKERLIGNYERSRYHDEISFEEYAIWWYHFFYTAVTNRLIDRGVIQMPADGVTTYLVWEKSG